MNSTTLLKFAKNIGGDIDAMNETLRSHGNIHAIIASSLLGSNIEKFYHDNFDLFGRLSTSKEDLAAYRGPISDAIRLLISASFETWYNMPVDFREYYAQKTRGIGFNEMVRRDFMRSVANTEWICNKYVFEFSDELLYSLLSSMEYTTANKMLKEDGQGKQRQKCIPDMKLIKAKLFLDRFNRFPFRTFALDVSANRIFRNSGIYAIQITPLYYSENSRAVIHTEVILENGDIYGTFAYDVDYSEKPDALVKEDGSEWVNIVLINSDEILGILTGKTEGVKFSIREGEWGSTYNSVIGAVCCQVLNYLGSDDSDIEESSDTKNTYRPTPLTYSWKNKLPSNITIQNTYKELRKFDCGFNYAKSVQEYREESAPTHATGSPKKPHVRKAHWHNYWIGSGNDRRLVRKWLSDMKIKMDFNSDLKLE